MRAFSALGFFRFWLDIHRILSLKVIPRLSYRRPNKDPHTTHVHAPSLACRCMVLSISSKPGKSFLPICPHRSMVECSSVSQPVSENTKTSKTTSYWLCTSSITNFIGTHCVQGTQSVHLQCLYSLRAYNSGIIGTHCLQMKRHNTWTIMFAARQVD